MNKYEIKRKIIQRLNRLKNKGVMMSMKEYVHSEECKLDDMVDKCIEIVKEVFDENDR